jgi:hypothetical protein
MGEGGDCERAIRITLDPLHRETLTNIREFWIALAHKSRFLSDDALATQIAPIGRPPPAKLDRDAGQPLLILNASTQGHIEDAFATIKQQQVRAL